MAKKEHLKILRRGVSAWNIWRKRNRGVELDLSRAHFRGADLEGADLHGVNLCAAQLYEANLSRANLRDADLNRAELFQATLKGADLRRAKLAGVGFFWADLCGADFRGTDLRGVDFSSTIVSGAKFGRAIMGDTTLADIDLSEVDGLETVEHYGPSRVGIDTVYLSKADIPESFLRQAGVPESFIERMKDLVFTTEPIHFYSCFISYSRRDKAFGRRLYSALQSRSVPCWIDEKDILPGEDIYHQVARGIRRADKVLLCCSKHSLASWWVENEIATAFEKEQQLMKQTNKKVNVLIPLNLDGSLFTDQFASGYGAKIRTRLAPDFTGYSRSAVKFDEQVEALVRALRADSEKLLR
jgi:TIR domain/Pentapeptide repeats (8 copies)